MCRSRIDLLKELLAGFSLIYLVGCAQTATHEMVVLQDAVITSGQEEPRLVKRGEKVTVPSDQVTRIEAPGYGSVLIPPTQGNSSQFSVNLRPTDGWGQDLVSKQLDDELNKVLISFNQVQALLKRNQGEQAISMVEMLEKKYPKLLGLRLLKARSYVAMKKTDEAKKVLQAVVKDFPENRTTRKFLEVFLRGQEFRAPASVCEEMGDMGDVK